MKRYQFKHPRYFDEIQNDEIKKWNRTKTLIKLNTTKKNEANHGTTTARMLKCSQ